MHQVIILFCRSLEKMNGTWCITVLPILRVLKWDALEDFTGRFVLINWSLLRIVILLW